MAKDVLPAPEKLDGTRSCELAALLVTLNFTPVDNALATARGDGIPGRLGYWRFLPQHPANRYKLGAVLERGLDPHQAAAIPTPKLPVYPEQAYIAALFHNIRALTESIHTGATLRLTRCGFLYIFQRVESAPIPELPGAPTVRTLLKTGTRRTELAAALATLGFEPTRASAPGVTASTSISHELAAITWMLPETSADGRWNLQERLARWADDAWCSQDSNTDPIAAMADAAWNLRHLRKNLQDARNYIRVQNGTRSIILNQNASQKQWDRAAQFLKRH